MERIDMSISDLFETELIVDPARKVIDAAQSVLLDYGIAYVSYLSISDNGLTPDIATSYSDEWVEHYAKNDYHLVDPVLPQAWDGHRPTNWLDVLEQDRAASDFFDEAREFGVHRSGMTIPIRDSENRRAYFSISGDMSAVDWALIIKTYSLEFKNLAFVFHTYYTRAKTNADPIQYLLSFREQQVLSWAAAGKTAWETSRILNLSQRTIESYIRNSMIKLDVANKTPAVAVAANFDLLEKGCFLPAQT